VELRHIKKNPKRRGKEMTILVQDAASDVKEVKVGIGHSRDDVARYPSGLANFGMN
jgi:hypothetical protein